MKSSFIFSCSKILPLVLCLTLCGAIRSRGQSQTGWTGATDGNWSVAGNWTNGIPNSGSPSARILNFGPLGNARPNSTNNINAVPGHRIFFNSGATNYTLYLASGTTGTTLFDFGANQPQIQNDSTNLQTFDMPFRMQASSLSGAANQFANINPTSSDIVFTTNASVTLSASTHLKFFSSAGRSVTFFGPLFNAAGAINALTLATTGSGGRGATVIFYNTNACTNNFILCGTLRLATNNVTSFPMTLGDTSSTIAPSANLQLDNGLLNNSALIIQSLQPSPTNSKTIGNTAVGSGSATYAGTLTLGTNLQTIADPAGKLVFTGDVDFQNPSGTGPRTIFVSGAGDTAFNGNFTNASTGSSALTKTNAGTLTLSGSNANRVLYTLGGGVLSISSSNAIGIPTGVNYPDKVNFTDNATLRVTNSFTLGRNAGALDNAGFRIKGGSTGTVEVLAASTFTIDGPIIDIPATGSGTFNKTGAGTLVLQQTNTYSLATLVSQGTLGLAGFGSIISSNITVAAGATLDASTRTDGTLTLGGLQKLSGNGTVSGIVVTNGAIAPGSSIGTLTFNSSPTLNGVMLMEIDKGNVPTSDKLVINGNPLIYGGSLVVNNIGAALTGGEVFDLFDATSFVGGFSSTNLPSLGAGLNWYLGSLTNNGTISVNRAPVPGAMTLNTLVNQAAALLTVKLIAVATDPDGNPMTVTGASYAGGNGSSVSLVGPNINYTPGPNFTGNESFTYTLSDNHGGGATGTVNVTVVPSGETFNRVAINSLPGGDVQLIYAGIPDYNYALDWTHSLTAPVTWIPLTTNQADNIGSLTFTNTPSGGTDFYRARYVP